MAMIVWGVMMLCHIINNWNFVCGFHGMETLDMDSEGKKLVSLLWRWCELGLSSETRPKFWYGYKIVRICVVSKYTFMPHLHLCLNNYINIIIVKHHLSQLPPPCTKLQTITTIFVCDVNVDKVHSHPHIAVSLSTIYLMVAICPVSYMFNDFSVLWFCKQPENMARLYRFTQLHHS